MQELTLSYPAKIRLEKNVWAVAFIDFDAFSEGDTLQEAIFNAQEALDVTLLGLVDTKQVIKAPSQCTGGDVYYISASPEVCVPILLYQRRKNEDKTIADVAKAMHVSLQRYHNIESGRNITLKTLKSAAAAMGATVEIKFNFPNALEEVYS